jgi:hypothetical protein
MQSPCILNLAHPRYGMPGAHIHARGLQAGWVGPAGTVSAGGGDTRDPTGQSAGPRAVASRILTSWLLASPFTAPLRRWHGTTPLPMDSSRFFNVTRSARRRRRS